MHGSELGSSEICLDLGLLEHEDGGASLKGEAVRAEGSCLVLGQA